MDRGGWQATVHWVARAGHDLATKEREPFSQVWEESTMHYIKFKISL